MFLLFLQFLRQINLFCRKLDKIRSGMLTYCERRVRQLSFEMYILHVVHAFHPISNSKTQCFFP